MKKILSILLSFIMISSITAGIDFSAYALTNRGSCGANVYYTFDDSTNTLTISGSGVMADYTFSDLSPFSNQTYIKTIVVEKGITSIGDWAFHNCTGLTSITIGDSVTSIGEGAFYGCTSLTSITIPNSVTNIGERAFSICKSLTNITVDSNNKYYDSRNYCNAIIETSTNTLIAGCKNTVIPNSVTSIGDYAFEYCTSLTSITIPNSVTSIGEGAFGHCKSLTSITMPNSVTSIGEGAFYGCTSLTSITIPNSVTSIGDYAFRGCSSITSIIIPNSVTSIGGSAFEYCTSLTSITIPNSVTNIGESAFENCSNLNDVYYSGTIIQLKSIAVAEGNECWYNANFSFNYCTSPNTDPCITHTWDNGAVTVDPDCIHTGTKLFTCTVCGATKEEYVPETGVHTYDNGAITTQPTCTKAGIKTFTCTGCGATITESVPATGVHTYDSGTITTQPTCTKAGIKTFTCTGCGATITESVPATGVHTYDSGVITTQPTCIGTGIKTYTCTGCGDTKTEIVPITNVHAYNDGVITTQPTCVATGIKTYTCTLCGATKTETVPITNVHTYNDGVVITQPTCAATGIKTYTCTLCGATKTEIVPVTNVHTYNDGAVTTQPTCTTTGVKTYTCTICGTTKDESIAALDHSYTKNITLAPTYTSDGICEYRCTRCTESYEESIEQLTLPYKTKVNSYCADTYKVELNKSGYLVFDFIGESDNCNIEIYDEDYSLVTNAKPIFKEFYKKSYLQARQGSTVPSEEQIIALLSGTYYIEVTCPKDDNYSGYYEMSIDYHPSKETLTENKYNFYYDAPTATDIDLNRSYNGFLGGKYTAYTYSGKLIQTTDTRDAYRFVIPKGSGWSQLSVTLDTKEFPPLTGQCEVIVYNEEFEPCANFNALTVNGNESKNEIVYLYEGMYYIAVSSGSPIEYTLNTAYKPSGTYTCVNHEYKLEKYQKSTCTKNGYKDYKCAICNTTYREILNKTSHINVKDKAVAATFNSSGLTEGSHCSVCGAIIKKQTVVAKLGSPKLNKVSTGKKQFKAVWKAISRVDGYQIQYSTNSEFKKGNKTVTCKGYSATSKVVGKLKAKKKYYVRVRAYKKINGKNVYSKWSAKKTVKTK